MLTTARCVARSAPFPCSTSPCTSPARTSPGSTSESAAARRRVAHTARIDHRVGDILECERLARRWFSVVHQGAFDRLGDLVADDVVLVSKVRPGEVVEGRDDFVRFVQETVAESLYEATTSEYHPLDHARIVVEGRVRWIDEDRVIRDDPVTWAMEFRDGLLVRFVPARTRIEAETILGAPTT